MTLEKDFGAIEDSEEIGFCLIRCNDVIVNDSKNIFVLKSGHFEKIDLYILKIVSLVQKVHRQYD